MKIYWDGNAKNIIGPKIKKLRKAANLTQEGLAVALQLEGYAFTSLTILRIENGTRFVPDYEVKQLARYFHVPYEDLLD